MGDPIKELYHQALRFLAKLDVILEDLSFAVAKTISLVKN